MPIDLITLSDELRRAVSSNRSRCYYIASLIDGVPAHRHHRALRQNW